MPFLSQPVALGERDTLWLTHFQGRPHTRKPRSSSRLRMEVKAFGAGGDIHARDFNPCPLPGLKQTAQHHAGLAPRRAARSPADLAAATTSGAQAALGQVVVGRHANLAHKDEQLVLMAQEPFRLGLTRMAFRLGKLLTQGPHQ